MPLYWKIIKKISKLAWIPPKFTHLKGNSVNTESYYLPTMISEKLQFIFPIMK